MKRVLQTIVRDNERYSISNSSELSLSKPDLYIEKLALQGGATATTEDIVVTRSGKNLLDGNLRVTPKTLNGITIRYLPDEDCYLFDGTCTANSSHYLITHNLFVNGRITASMVVISGTCKGSAQFSISYRDNLSETTFPLWVTKNIINGNLSINPGAHKYIGATWFFIAKGTSFDNYKIKIQMELGTVVTEYEPYLSPKSITISKTYPLSSTDKLTITKNSVKYNDTDITSEVTGLDEFFSIGSNVSTITTSANIALGEITEDISYSVKSNKRAVYTGEDVIYSSQTFIKE